jgi:hypothetical protein
MEEPPSTGEERLLSKLKRAYKNDLDIAKMYCEKNISAEGKYPKTKRPMILERYLAHEEEEEDQGDSTGEDNDHDKVDGSGEAGDNGGPGATASLDLPMPFAAPAATATTTIKGEVPVPMPDQIAGVDVMILAMWLQIWREGRRQAQLT